MPNHVSNAIVMPTEIAHGLLTITKLDSWDDPEEVLVDFDKIVPQPPNMEGGGCHMEPVDSQHRHPSGVVCWYSWRNANWGTKWGAYNCGACDLNEDMTLLTFDTAWSHPQPVVDALAAKHPGVRFVVSWADEDTGYNLGAYTIRGDTREATYDREATGTATAKDEVFALGVQSLVRGLDLFLRDWSGIEQDLNTDDDNTDGGDHE